MAAIRHQLLALRWPLVGLLVAAGAVFGYYLSFAKADPKAGVLGRQLLETKGIHVQKVETPAGVSYAVSIGRRDGDANLTRADIDAIVGLKRIGYLSIGGKGGPWVAELLDAVGQLKGTDVVQISGGKLDEAAVAALNKFVPLPTLSLSEDAGRAFSGLKNASILHLAIHSANLDDKALSGLSSDLRLESLDLGGNPNLHGARFDKIAALKTLKKLRLEGVEVEAAGLAHLKNHPSLEYLSLIGTRLKDRDLEAIRTNKALRTLYLDGQGFTDESLPALGDMENLENLTLYSFVTEQGLASLKGAKKLAVLKLRIPLTEVGIRHLAALDKLEELGTPIPTLNRAIVRELASLKQLKLLSTGRFPPGPPELLKELALTNPGLRLPIHPPKK